MTQTIQIKRSTATAAPSTLQNGELAYSANSDKLYIGRPGGTTGDVDVIGGKAYTSLLDSNSANWDTAYGWGDHAAAGYLTSYTETDPVFSASAASGIASGDITNWDTAYGWGNHASAGYLTSYTETDPVFSASAASGIVAGDITNWDTAYGWGNHAAAGYLTSFTEVNDLTANVTWATVPNAFISQGSVTQHEAALSITESQISDLQSYLTAESDTLDSVTDRGATTTNTLTVGALVVSGDLTVSGTTTTVNTEEVNIADNFVLLNSNFTGAATENAGIEINRGSDANVDIRYNEANNVWEFTNDGSTYQALSGRTDEEIQDLAGALTTAGTKTNITVTYNDANNRIDYSVATATASTLGVASFNSTEFSVTSGAVAIVALDGGSF